MTHITYITHVTYRSHTVKLTFEVYIKTNKIFSYEFCFIHTKMPTNNYQNK